MTRNPNDDVVFEQLLAVEPLSGQSSRDARARASGDGKLRGRLPLLIEPEAWWQQVAWGLVAMIVLAAFAWFTSLFHVAAHPGTDQNAYLVGAKNLARDGSMATISGDPHAFIGRMWVVTDGGAFYPKYPAGMPVIASLVLKIGRPSWVYWINPVAMVLGLMAVFMLARTIAGSFAGVLAILILAASPVTLSLANNPNSHALAMCFATLGMYLLVGWWQRMGTWRAMLAGLLLGYAATIRYTEGVLGAALVLVAVMNWRSVWQTTALVVSWLVPVGIQVAVSYSTVGSVTGYDSTHESAAFDWKYLGENWEMIVRQLHGTALVFMLPIGVLGLLLMIGRAWKLALVLWLWFLPATVLYMAYYWAPETQGVGILRFFFSVMPVIAIAAAWCLTRAVTVTPGVIAGISALVIVLGGGAYSVWVGIPVIQSEHRRASAIRQAEREILDEAKVPAGSVLFGPREMLHHLQFIGDLRLYESDHFTRAAVDLLSRVPKDQPTGFQRRRADDLLALLKDKSEEELAKLAAGVMKGALKDRRRVFVVQPKDGAVFKLDESLVTRPMRTWTDNDLNTLWAKFGGPLREPAIPDKLVTWELVEVTSKD